jgi:hypothetical protein
MVHRLAYSLILEMEVTCCSETSAEFQRIYGRVFKEVELFITVSVTTQTPTPFFRFKRSSILSFCKSDHFGVCILSGIDKYIYMKSKAIPVTGRGGT